MRRERFEKNISDLAELRLLVAALGELSPTAWWNSSFFSPTAESFLKYNFPRSAISASVGSVQQAAGRLHDASVGAVGAYHLFRFPSVIEERVHHILLREGAQWSDEVTSVDSAMNRLREFAEEPSQEASPGAVDCGTLDLSKKGAALSVAGVYLAAFENDVKTFPYFQMSN